MPSNSDNNTSDSMPRSNFAVVAGNDQAVSDTEFTDANSAHDATSIEVGQRSDRSHSWDTIQDRLRSSIVSIIGCHPVAFEESSPSRYFGTGFVVDAEQGIIMSNRHIMGSGPAYHKASFFDNQEVFLQPTYYDPIHDFAFFRYDPSELQGFEPKAICMAPEKAHTGLEFRLVGNTGNEKMSVHQGELSQLDRNPPVYDGDYSDFNTFYFHASTTSGGGSSGAPVVDITGDAVAINCGKHTASALAYLLPLERAIYALDYVKQGLVPPRGTLQAVFEHISHVKANRLGLDSKLAASEGIDSKCTTGLLKITNILPDGPAFNILETGDIVLSSNGEHITGFTKMSEVVDSSVGKALCLRVFRRGTVRELSVNVGNIYDITPSKLLCIGGTYLCNMSYQQAVNWSAPIYGVNIAGSYRGFLKPSSYGNCRIIYSANGKPTPNVDALVDILKDIPRDKPIVFKTKNHQDLREEAVFVARHPPVAQPSIIYTRSPVNGFWSIKPYDGMSESSGTDLSESMAMLSMLDQRGDLLARGYGNHPFVKKVSNSAVLIASCNITPADGDFNRIVEGTGLIVDKHKGIVICSSDMTANPTSNVWITFAGLVCVQATLAYTHPLYPISFIKYKPEELFRYGNSNVDNCVVIDEIDIWSQDTSGSSTPLAVGTPVTTVAGVENGSIGITSSTVCERYNFSASACSVCITQRHFNTNVFDLSPPPRTNGTQLGAVYDGNGKLCGIWVWLPECPHPRYRDISFGLDISVIRSALSALQLDSSDSNIASTLGVEFVSISLGTAHDFGVSQSRISEIIQNTSMNMQQLFKVEKTLSMNEQKTDMADSLEVGDIVLNMDGKLVEYINELGCIYGRSSVGLTVVRNMCEVSLTVKTLPLLKSNTRRIVFWAGMYMQEPYAAALEKANSVKSGVYMFCAMNGSPVEAENDLWGTFITEIDDKPIKTLDDMVDAVKKLKSKDTETFNARVASNEQFSSGMMPGCDVKIHSVTLAGQDLVYSIRTNDHYFPAWQIIRGPHADDNWVLEVI